jgi:hypothetical protein
VIAERLALRRAVPANRWMKAAIFALLLANAAAFSLGGTLTEALDELAWLTLLALFELETAYGAWVSRVRATRVVHLVRILAAAAIAAVAIRYAREEQWLDFINTSLWIAVVVFLEFEVRYPRLVASHRMPWTALAAALYSSLGALVIAWGWRGEWFDAYDAALWLAAFVAIEINVLAIPSAERACEIGNEA